MSINKKSDWVKYEAWMLWDILQLPKEKKIEPYVLIWKAVHDILSEKDRLQSSVYI